MFAVWEVYGYCKGNNSLLAIYPYRDQTRANEHASRVLGGYVLRSRTAEQLHNRREYATGDSKTTSQPEPVATAVPVLYRIWDEVNERYTTCNGLASDAVATYASRSDAVAMCNRLNQFGGYGGMMGLRFTVR